MRTVTALTIAGLVVIAILTSAIGCGKSTPPATPSKEAPAPAQNKQAPAAPAPAASEAAASQTAQDVKALCDASCSACHPMGKVESYSGNETWKAIVDRMIQKHDAKISPEDATKIIAYLEKTYNKK